MDPQLVASAYTNTTFESAPPLKIVRLMYEGALRFLEQAEAIDPNETPALFSEALNRADAVVSELRVSIHPDHAPELAKNLNDLYLFVESRIRDAFLEQDPEYVPAARRVLETLLDGWRQVEVNSDALAESSGATPSSSTGT